MKNKYTKIAFMATVMAFSLFAFNANAQENSNRGPQDKPLRVRAEANLEGEVRQGRGGDDMPSPKARLEGEARINTSENRGPGNLKDVAQKRDIMMIKRDIKTATATNMFRRGPNNASTTQKKIDRPTFQNRRDALVRQLNVAIGNLTNIAARLAERITKAEEAGRNMTDAKASLVVANQKLLQAKTAVSTFAAFTPAGAGTTTASTTVQVDIEKARQVGDAAIKAVKDARDAFKKVVQDIAHNMGLGKTATSTAPTVSPVTSTTTATTTTPVATTTASTTTN